MNRDDEAFRPRVTVAAIVEQHGRFLLVEEETPEGLMLNNPAGHLDTGESPQQAVVREVLEETARGFVPEAVVGVYLSRFVRPARNEDVTFVRLAFSGSIGDADPTRKLDHGIVRTLWLTPDELRACRERHRSPLLMRCVDDYLAGRRYPLELVIADATLFAPEVKR